MKTSRLNRLREELGTSGMLSLALIALAAAFHFAVLEPLQARHELLKSRLERQALAGPPAGGGAQGVAGLYRFLEKDEEATDWLAKVHAIGTASGVQLKSAAYRAQPTAGRIERYEIGLPVAATYPQIRGFLRRLLEEIPVLSVDHVALRREARDGTVHAELRLTLHMVKS